MFSAPGIVCSRMGKRIRSLISTPPGTLGPQRPSGFDSSKAKAGVIGRPTPVRIAENWLEDSRNLVEKAAAFLARQRGAERIGECVQPPAGGRLFSISQELLEALRPLVERRNPEEPRVPFAERC